MAGTDDAADQSANSLTETERVTIAAVLHLVQLLTAELVLNRSIEIGKLEQAVHAMIGDFTSPTENREAREGGLARARYLVEQVFTQVRAQAELRKALSFTAGETPKILN